MSSGREDDPLLMSIIVGTFLFGAILGVAGVVFVILGASGDTEFELFGQTFKSQNVGIGAIFIGAVTVILLIRRVLAVVASREKRALRSASKGIRITNEVAGQLTSLVDQSGLQDREHSMMIEGTKDAIVAKGHGEQLQTITAKDLESLPPELLDHVVVYEQALEMKYVAWKKLYARRGEPTVDSELRRLGASMSGDLEGILGFLESAGLELADHYLRFRDVIARA